VGELAWSITSFIGFSAQLPGPCMARINIRTWGCFGPAASRNVNQNQYSRVADRAAGPRWTGTGFPLVTRPSPFILLAQCGMVDGDDHPH
jgi:hypothetical protein